MFISYFDETGDDGYPKYSSSLFVLTSVTMHYQKWKDNYETIMQFRRQMKQQHGLPVKVEMHTKHFLTDKNPYRAFGFSRDIRRKIIAAYFRMIAALDVQIVNVVIDKKNIVRNDYNVLEKAFGYNMQRIANTLSKADLAHKFMIISDEGRIGAMRAIARKIQRINLIQSNFSTGLYQAEIKNLLEDPLPKSSRESAFIQIADAVSFIVFLFATSHFQKMHWGNRIANTLDNGDEVKLLNIIKPKLNLAASRNREYGIVYYPQAQ